MAARIQRKTVRKMLGSGDVLSLFQDMMGTSENKKLDYDIVWPKFKKIQHHSHRLISILKWLSEEAPFLDDPSPEKAEIDAFVAKMEGMFKEIFAAPDLDRMEPKEMFEGDIEAKLDYRPDFSKVAEDLPAFSECYQKIEDAEFLTIAASICEKLIPYRAHIEHKEKLDDRIFRLCGVHLAPIPDLPQCDFKTFHTNAGSKSKEYVKVYLHKLFNMTHDIYTATQIPDVDPKKFAEMVMNSMRDVKKQIPRCDQAFSILENSVGLLEGNFQSYYTDMKCSGNTSVIMENFILDVTKANQGASVTVRSQFRTIITKYRKMMSQSLANDPRNRELLKHVDANLESLEKGDDGDEDDEEDEDAGSPDVEEEAPVRTPAEKKSSAKARNQAHRSMDKAINKSTLSQQLGLEP